MSDLGQTPSGLPVKPVYGPADRLAEPPDPGRFPFTRGNYKNGYRYLTGDPDGPPALPGYSSADNSAGLTGALGRSP